MKKLLCCYTEHAFLYHDALAVENGIRYSRGIANQRRIFILMGLCLLL